MNPQVKQKIMRLINGAKKSTTPLSMKSPKAGSLKKKLLSAAILAAVGTGATVEAGATIALIRKIIGM